MGTQLVESWTKTQLAVFFAVLLLAVDEYVFKAGCGVRSGPVS